jgi:LysM repeat protein
MNKVLITIVIVFLFKSGIAQTMTAEQYIEQNKDLAIREMKRMGIPAAITLAQGLLETESGNSDLVKKSNNHFGIKCKSTWTAASVSHDDDAPGECFRYYKNAEESYRDHSNFLRGSDRYAFLFKLDPRDYKAWAYGLKKAGYATNPNYPKILIKNIEDNNLQQYTLMAVNDEPFYDASRYKSDPEEKAFDDLTTTPGDTETSTGTAVINKAQQQFETKFIINGATAISAKKGTSLLAIADENNIKLSKLLEYNDLEKDGLLDKDQIIFLEKKSKEGQKDFYIVQQDETAYDAAQENGIRLQNLFEYNGISENETLHAGTKVYLKPGTAVQQGLKSENETNNVVRTHAVQPKEGLYSISKKYGVTVAQIKEWNKLPNDNLRVGQQLIISMSK